MVVDEAVPCVRIDFDVMRNASRSQRGGPAHSEDTQYLHVYVGQLRQKIEERPEEPRFILTEPGIGYRVAET